MQKGEASGLDESPELYHKEHKVLKNRGFIPCSVQYCTVNKKNL